MNSSNHLLKDFKEYLANRDLWREEDESIFSLGFTAPMSGGKRLCEDSTSWVAWEDVEKFLRMTQESLRVREQRLEELEGRLQEKSKALEREQREKSQVPSPASSPSSRWVQFTPGKRDQGWSQVFHPSPLFQHAVAAGG
jgi:hypothetical protein